MQKGMNKMICQRCMPWRAHDSTAAFKRITEEFYDGAFERKLKNAINSTEDKEVDDVVVKSEPVEHIRAEGDSSDDEGVQFVGVSRALYPDEMISAIEESRMVSSDDSNRSWSDSR